MKYIRIIWAYLCGLCYVVWMRILPKKPLSPVGDKKRPHLVVTLTSYGRRAKSVVVHALESMLVQTLRPDRIILWLDNVAFSTENLPKKLRKMRDKYGIEIRFTDDIRSYKKLIPALELCPDDILVTIDDDLVYKRGLLRCLFETHLAYPDEVLCALAHSPVVQGTGFAPYNSWKHNLTQMSADVIFPLGGSGTLYPPHSLYSDVMDRSLFMKLAPQADDVWFWAMGIMAGTRVRMVNFGCPFFPIDLLFQKLHADASLMSKNLHQDMNDVQIQNVLESYPTLLEHMNGLYPQS